MARLLRRHSELRKNLMKIRPGATPSEVRARIAELCAQNDYDPVKELIEMVQKGQRIEMSDGTIKFIPLDPKDVISIHKEVLQYIAPKLRTIDVQASIEANISISVTKFSGAAIDGEVLEESEVPTMIRATVLDAADDNKENVDFDKMSKAEVLAYAQSLGLEVTNNWKKSELIDKLVLLSAEDDDGDDGDEEDEDTPSQDSEGTEETEEGGSESEQG